LKVLVACEFSGVVRDAFLKKGHDAVSCDLLPSESNHPEDSWRHIQGDVLNELDSHHWDILIAHPPCTYLSHAGCRWLYPKKGKGLNQERYKKGIAAKDFFMQFYNAPIEKICIENPFPSPLFKLPEATQVIQPYMFGHQVQKKTLLWLKGLPKLQPTNIVPRGEFVRYNGIPHCKWFMEKYGDAKGRSITFEGIAKAMAEQWGDD
jgi:hypothetical protein